VQKQNVHLLLLYNGTGEKTRLFNDLGKQESLWWRWNWSRREILYISMLLLEDYSFGQWSRKRRRTLVLKINKDSKFFKSLSELRWETGIRPLLQALYVQIFDFFIGLYQLGMLMFIREDRIDEEKQSGTNTSKYLRGEERLFYFVLLLAIMQIGYWDNQGNHMTG